MKNKKFKNHSFINALLNAIRGLESIFIQERNFKIDVIIFLIVVLCSFYLKLNYLEFSVIIICCINVLAAEVLNSIIEYICDLIDVNFNAKIKYIKDVAASIPLMMTICSIIVGILIFTHKFM